MSVKHARRRENLSKPLTLHEPRPKRRPKPTPRRPPAKLPPSTPPPVPPTPPVVVGPDGFTSTDAERLLWRAGFGPRPGQAAALARQGRDAAVRSLTRPAGAANLVGPAPHDSDGNALAPADAWGHDHLFWLDRMVRSDQSLVERMALIWHDWFATSNDKVGSQQKMLDQAELFRTKGLGSFRDLALSVTVDPAMLLWLDGSSNHRRNTNENYGRELMELFTLGADRGAYTETDVRELARALTGWDNDWSAELGDYNFHYDPNQHDTGTKTIFGRTANYGWEDAINLCVDHPLHASFFVTKLWSYFVPSPPSATTRAQLEAIYTGSGLQIRPVVEAILTHPDLYTGARMVKPPVVWIAGVVRALGRGIDHDAFIWYADESGQRLFRPPNVAGWDDARWLDTSTLRGRWLLAYYPLGGQSYDGSSKTYPVTETPEQAVAAALAALGNPSIEPTTRAYLVSWANACLPNPMQTWQQSPYRAQRQNALRHLIATSPDFQTA